MSDVPDLWGQYYCLQSKLLRKTKIDDHGWGLEAGLDRLLTAVETPTIDVVVERAVASRARRERNQRYLLCIHSEREAAHREVSETALDAKRALHRIRARVGVEHWRLLCAVADGYEYSELTVLFGAAPGALRARVLRLRRRVTDATALPRAS
jgi:hypothetical protein